MRYVALLRGINVGLSVRIDMTTLRLLFENIGYKHVSTYINSGNVFFESIEAIDFITNKLQTTISQTYKTNVPVLVLSEEQVLSIVQSIPLEWENDSTQKTDVAYLFEEINSASIIGELPIKKDYVDVIYTPGAIIWHVTRDNYNKSQLNKLIGHKLYQKMTVRNVNTARYLADRLR